MKVREIVKTKGLRIQTNASGSRLDDLNKIGGKCSRSTIDLSSPPRRQSSKFSGYNHTTYHPSVVSAFWVIVMTCPFENERSPGYSANHVSGSHSYEARRVSFFIEFSLGAHDLMDGHLCVM